MYRCINAQYWKKTVRFPVSFIVQWVFECHAWFRFYSLRRAVKYGKQAKISELKRFVHLDSNQQPSALHAWFCKYGLHRAARGGEQEKNQYVAIHLYMLIVVWCFHTQFFTNERSRNGSLNIYLTIINFILHVLSCLFILFTYQDSQCKTFKQSPNYRRGIAVLGSSLRCGMLLVRIPIETSISLRIFRLLPVSHSSEISIQMKSIMTFIQSNRYIEIDIRHLKNGGGLKMIWVHDSFKILRPIGMDKQP